MAILSFTWEQGRDGPNWVKEKLDRVLAYKKWFRLFIYADVLNEETVSLDHSALYLDLR